MFKQAMMTFCMALGVATMAAAADVDAGKAKVQQVCENVTKQGQARQISPERVEVPL
jgi:hypothetical protein